MRSLVRVDAVSGDFDFRDATEGKEQLYEIFGRLFRGLFHNVANGVGDCGLEHHALGLQASKVHTHELARLKHRFCTMILPLREVKCKPFAQSRDEANRLYFREVSAHT
jgi:hypothetical protein